MLCEVVMPRWWTQGKQGQGGIGCGKVRQWETENDREGKGSEGQGREG